MSSLSFNTLIVGSNLASALVASEISQKQEVAWIWPNKTPEVDSFFSYLPESEENGKSLQWFSNILGEPLVKKDIDLENFWWNGKEFNPFARWSEIPNWDKNANSQRISKSSKNSNKASKKTSSPREVSSSEKAGFQSTSFLNPLFSHRALRLNGSSESWFEKICQNFKGTLLKEIPINKIEFSPSEFTLFLASDQILKTKNLIWAIHPKQYIDLLPPEAQKDLKACLSKTSLWTKICLKMKSPNNTDSGFYILTSHHSNYEPCLGHWAENSDAFWLSFAPDDLDNDELTKIIRHNKKLLTQAFPETPQKEPKKISISLGATGFINDFFTESGAFKNLKSCYSLHPLSTDSHGLMAELALAQKYLEQTS